MLIKKYFNPLFFMLLAAFWGGSFIAIKIIIAVFPPFFAAALRALIALITLRIFFYFSKKPLQQNIACAQYGKIGLVGLFAQGLPFAFLFWGEQSVTPGLAGILNATTSVWIFLLSLCLFQDARTHIGIKFIGLLVGMVGVFIIFVPSLGHLAQGFWGALSILLMAVSYAIASVLYQYLFLDKLTVDFYTNLYYQQWVSFIFLLLLTLLFEPLPSLHFVMLPSVMGAALYLGVFSTAIAWMIYYHLIHKWGAVRASTVAYVIPIMALGWDFLFFADIPEKFEILGVAVILLGVILLQCGPYLKKIRFH